MTVELLPLRSDTEHFGYTVTLDEVVYRLDFRWNGRLLSWFLALSDADGTPILAPQRLVVDAVLFQESAYLRALPPGALAAVNVGEPGQEALRLDLGERVLLLYAPVADLAAP